MAYFGSSTSARAGTRFDSRSITIGLVCVAGIGISIALGSKALRKEVVKSEIVVREMVKPAEAAQAAAAAPKLKEVLVPLQNIPPGKRLTPAMFKIEARAVDGIEDKVAVGLSDIANVYSAVSISAGSPLLKASYNAAPGMVDITERIPPGYRAVAIPVNVETGVEGWVRPGARVDVVWTTGSLGRQTVVTVVENAQVLSAERSTEVNPTEDSKANPVPRHITLLVTTQDAQRIQLAKSSGQLSLSLRGEEDAAPAGSSAITASHLLRKTTAKPNDDFDGKVQFGGVEYVLRQGKLLLASEYAKQKQESQD